MLSFYKNKIIFYVVKPGGVVVQEKVRVNILTNSVITRDGIENILRSKEYQILRLLLKHAPKCVSRRDISSQVWSGTYSADATINQTIKSIRQKLGDHNFSLIQTVPRVGYQIEHPELFVLEEVNTESKSPKLSEKTIADSNIKENTSINGKNNKALTAQNNNGKKYHYKVLISIFFALLFSADIACHIRGSCLFHPENEKQLKFSYNTPAIVNMPGSKDEVTQDVENNMDNGSLLCSYSGNKNKYIVLDCLSQNRNKPLDGDPNEISEAMSN